jgi:hypothetical protein
MLVRFVSDGDVVLHYHQPTRSIVAFSIARGFPEETTMRWPDRLASPEVPARAEELIHFTELDEPMTLEAIRDKDADIREIKSRLEADNPGATIYYPFAIWDHEIRPSQGMYLSKLPVEVLRLYPDLAAQVSEGIDLVEVTEGTRDTATLPRPGARPPVGASSGRTTTAGRQTDEKKKKAVEDWAMKRATELLEERRFSVENVCNQPGLGYDLRAMSASGDVVIGVEVKGSIMERLAVDLQLSEVEFARVAGEAIRSLLIVVDSIECTAEGDSYRASGGRLREYPDWTPEDLALVPIAYRFTLPT